MDGIVGLTATELAALVRSRALSAVDVVSAHLRHLDRVDPVVRAVVARDDEAALRRARALDDEIVRRGPVGPLHGVPFTVKDWIDAAGLPCAGESGDRERHPADDATAVARLRAAGGVLVAKTNVGVDHPLYGPCHHPLDPSRSPGGSSSGEAALVAVLGSPLGLGSDSGGSIRLPAAWCGVVGAKPTFGLVPLTGHFPRLGALHDGRTVIGPLARSVDDTWLALTVLAGPDGLDPGATPVPLGAPDGVAIAGLRVAALGEPGRRAQADLVRLGAVEVPAPANDVLGQAMELTQRYWDRTALSGPDADRLLWDWDRFRRRLLAGLADVDVLLTPTTDGPAPPARAMAAEDYRWTLPWSLTGGPATTVPYGHDHGLPLGLQVVARPWHDHVVAAAARALQTTGASGAATQA